MRFVDTSYWVGLLVPRDQHHSQAKAIWIDDPGPLISTNHVVGETWTFLRRRAEHQAAVAFLDAVDQSTSVAVIHVESSIEDEARYWLRRHGEREYSFVDAVSFAVMRRRRLTEVLAFDEDFAAAGFAEIRLP